MESFDVAEIKRHINVVGLGKKIQLVAESVSALDGRITSFEEQMERGFDEVKGDDQVFLCRAGSARYVARSWARQTGSPGPEGRSSLKRRFRFARRLRSRGQGEATGTGGGDRRLRADRSLRKIRFDGA
jgi:hypothetical protein